MSNASKGRRNEHRSINYLAKRGFIALRAAASKGMGGSDVLAANLTTGEVRVVQSKSNGNYNKNDEDILRMMLKSTKATNVRYEIHDWYDGNRHPVIKVIGLTPAQDVVILTDPKLKDLLGITYTK